MSMLCNKYALYNKFANYAAIILDAFAVAMRLNNYYAQNYELCWYN